MRSLYLTAPSPGGRSDFDPEADLVGLYLSDSKTISACIRHYISSGCPQGFSEVLAEETPFVNEGLRQGAGAIAEMVGKRKKTREKKNLRWLVTEKKGPGS